MNSRIMKAWVSSLFGVSIAVISSILLYKGTINFMWDGLLGLSLGFAIFMIPEKVESAIGSILKNVVKLILGKND